MIGLVPLAAVLISLAVTACGSTSQSSSAASTKSSAPTSTSAASTAASTSPPANAPAIVLGDKNFTEEYILGYLYAKAYQAAGYKVTLKSNIGSTELMNVALKSGSIDAYPEYVGTMLSALDNDNTHYASVADAAKAAAAFQAKHGTSYVAPLTPFEDAGELVVLKSFAMKHHLATIGDLKDLGPLKLVMYSPEITRPEGYPGFKKAYGISNVTPVPLDPGLTYSALDRGQAQVGYAFSTDPQLLSGKYVVLSNPAHVGGFQNVGLVIKTSLLQKLGPQFTALTRKLQGLLTTPAMQALNKAAVVEKQSPSAIANEFLKANGLLNG